MNTIVMEHSNVIFFHESEPANLSINQTINQSIRGYFLGSRFFNKSKNVQNWDQQVKFPPGVLMLKTFPS